MKHKHLLLLIIFSGIFYSVIPAQKFQFKRKLEVKSAGWNTFYLPAQVEAKSRLDFGDVRMLAIKKNGDTVEAPYSLTNYKDEISGKKIPLKILNPSHSNDSYYYTFEKTSKDNITKIELSFTQKNFESLVTVEGSHNQKEWFTLLKDYRILSIQNKATDYAFTNLLFPESSYPYYRLRVPSTTDPGLMSAIMETNGLSKGSYQDIKVSSAQTEIDKTLKQTIYTVTLAEELPVTNLKVLTKAKGDYFRSTTVFKLSDNNVAPQNEPPFKACANFILSSLGQNSFDIPKVSSKQIRLVVENLDNEPLLIDSVILKTKLQQVWVQFPEAKEYLVVYGNKDATLPKYDAADILQQTNPVMHTSVTIGNEEPLTEAGSGKPGHWFENDLFLYGLMAAIIVLLGYFSLTMMKKKQ